MLTRGVRAAILPRANHRFDDAWVDGRGGVVVEIDRRGGHIVSLNRVGRSGQKAELHKQPDVA